MFLGFQTRPDTSGLVFFLSPANKLLSSDPTEWNPGSSIFLLIDGEPAAEDLADRLRGPGFAVEWCRTSAQGRAAALSGKI